MFVLMCIVTMLLGIYLIVRAHEVRPNQYVKLEVGDLVRHRHHPHICGVVMMVATTLKGENVCDVLITINAVHPKTIGTVKYLNQVYWNKVEDEDSKTQLVGGLHRKEQYEKHPDEESARSRND